MREKIDSTHTKGCDDPILLAAALEFAEKGFGGARVDEIARRANVNKATLYYRIGDKEAVYHAVLDHVLGHIADEVCAAVATADGCERQIHQFITIIARNTEEMCCTAPIMLREVAGGGRNLPDVALKHMHRLLGALDSTIADGVKQGLFRPVNSFVVHMMVIGSLMLYATNAPIRRRICAQYPGSIAHPGPAPMSEAAEAVNDLVLASIRNPSGG